MSNTSENRGGKHNKTNKKKSKKKVILISISIVALLIIGSIAGGLGYTYNLLGKMDKVELNKANLGINENIPESKGIKNIVLYGIDAPDGELGRSDSIMVLTIDNDRKDLRVSSIMRDSYVNIDGHGKDKMNHAYAFGGPELAIKTLNQNFDLNISEFVSVNFTNLPKIIDSLGGIDLNITQAEVKYINFYIDELNRINHTNAANITTAGTQHVNGTQALAYSRIRYTDGGDYERTHRHRIVLTALFNKFKNTSPSEYPRLLNELLPMVKTNLSSNEILALAMDVVKMGNIQLQQARFPEDNYTKGEMIKGVYYQTFDKEATVKQLHEFIFEDKLTGTPSDNSNTAK